MLQIQDTPEKRAQLRTKFTVLALACIALAAFVAPGSYNRLSRWVQDTAGFSIGTLNFDPFHLGLDLQGGAHLVYEVDTRPVPADENVDEAVEGVRNVINRRVNAFGVGEPVIQTNKSGDTHRVIVELPGVSDLKAAIDAIGKTPILEFKELGEATAKPITPEQKEEIAKKNIASKTVITNALAAVRSGRSLDEVAKEFSQLPTAKEKGADMGIVDESYNDSKLLAWLKANRPGTTSGVLETDKGFYLLKNVETTTGPIKVKVRHILICHQGAQECTLTISEEEALRQAQELRATLTAQNFAEQATIRSTDGSASLGGELPEFGRNEMIPVFQDAAFALKTGEISQPVKSQFGYHIIYKEREVRGATYKVAGVYAQKFTEADFQEPASEWKDTGLGGAQLVRSAVQYAPNTNAPTVGLDFSEEGKRLFAEITSRNIGKPIAIFLDGEIISQPTVNTEITNGEAVIEGNFTLAQARTLVRELNAGALPLPVKLVSQQKVDASLGSESLTKSLTAALIGFGLVSLFVIVYYRLLGVLAVFGLGVYALIVLALFKIIPVTMTASGIAGFILSLGTAIDANILIFERMKEERRAGKRLHAAMEEGFVRAWPSIRDSNVSTLITCVILFWFGTSVVKGFALTLAVGVLVTMFTAVFVIRLFVRLVVPRLDEHTKLVLGAPKSPRE